MIIKFFYFPLSGYIQDEENCYNDCENMDNVDLQPYVDEISNALEKELSSDPKNMAEYFNDNDELKQKLISADWTVFGLNGELFGQVTVNLKGQMTSEETEIMRRWISGQNSDGLGEGFEQRPIQTDDGDLYVSMWQSDDSYHVYTENEMEEYLMENHRELLGGMTR